jgi:hypothetical protein
VSKYHPIRWARAAWRGLENLFQPHTLEEVIEMERESAARQKMQALDVIRRHEFVAHYSEAKLAALDSWIVQRGSK